MTIRPVDINGMIQRTDDVAYLKHNQDAKNEGKNNYYQNNSKKKKKPAEDGKVINKIQAGTFDVKI